MSAEEQRKELVKKCFEEKSATINGREYKMLKVNTKKSLKIMGLASKFEDKSMVFGDDEHQKLEKLLFDCFSFDDFILSKKEDHFDLYPGDYFTFFAIALEMVSYPFLAESPLS